MAEISLNAGQSSPVYVDADTTKYLLPAGLLVSGIWPNAESSNQLCIGLVGTWSRLCIHVISNTLEQASTLVSRINGVTGNQAITIPAGTTGFFVDDIHEDSVVAADLLGVKLVAGGSSPHQLQVSVVSSRFTLSERKSIVYCGVSLGVCIRSENEWPYAAIIGDHCQGFEIEANSHYKVQVAAIFSHMRVHIYANESDGDTTFRFRKNGADGNQIITVHAGQTGWFEDTTHTDTVAVGDVINYKRWLFGTLPSIVYERSISMVVESPARPLGIAYNEPSYIYGTRFHVLEGSYSFGATTEEPVQTRVRAGIMARNMVVSVVSPNNEDHAVTVTLRVNGVDSALAVTIPAYQAGFFTNNNDEVAISSESLVDWKLTTGDVYINMIVLSHFELVLLDGVVTCQSVATASAKVTKKIVGQSSAVSLVSGEITVFVERDFSDYAENKVLEHVVGKNSFTMPTAWLGLCTDNPLDSGTGASCHELPNAGGYARVQTSPSAWNAAANGVNSNAAALVFPTATADWGLVTHLVLLDSGVYGQGNVLVHNVLSEPLNIVTNDVPRFAPGALTVALD